MIKSSDVSGWNVKATVGAVAFVDLLGDSLRNPVQFTLCKDTFPESLFINIKKDGRIINGNHQS